ncbi:hypothetical protein SAMN05518670_1840 [Paenibacillus sp. OK076]|nr:hypothetical protein SAMN05518670_1840 [Paenibacillus sp. OK076]
MDYILCFIHIFGYREGGFGLKVGQAEIVELLRRSYIELALFFCARKFTCFLPI